MNKHLEGNLNEGRITVLENQYSFLQGKLAQLQDEKNSMQRIEEEQKKALDAVQAAQNFPTRMKAITDETKKLTERNREIKAKQKAEERKFLEAHQAAVDLEDKYRKLRAQVQAKKNLTLQDEDEPTVPVASESDIADIHAKTKATEGQRDEDERRLTAQLKQIEARTREVQHTVNVMEIQLKEKDQEHRLTMLKIKELKRLTRHNKLKPLTKSPTEVPTYATKQEDNRHAPRAKPQQERKHLDYEDEEDVQLDQRAWAAAEQSAKQVEDFEFRGPQRYR